MTVTVELSTLSFDAFLLVSQGAESSRLAAKHPQQDRFRAARSLSNRGYVLMLEEALAMESSPQGRRVRTLLRVLKSLCTRRRPDADVS